MTKNKIYVYLALLLTFNLLFSCQERHICTENPIGEKMINLSLLSDNLTINSKYYYRRQNEFGSYEFGQSGLVNDEFKILNNVIKKYIDVATDPYAIAFYLDNYISILKDSDSCKVIGFSTYTYANGKIIHRLFINNNNEFIESKKYSIQVYSIISNQLVYILQNYLFPESKSIKKSCIILKNPEMLNNIPTKSKYVPFPGESL